MIGRFIRGFVDGALSTLGIVVGASSAQSSIVIAAGIGGAVANAMANFLSALSAERADQYIEMREAEKAMVHKDLKGTIIERNIHKETVRAGFLDGLGTFAGGLIPVLPFLIAPASKPLFISIGSVVVALFAVSVFIGKLSKENVLISASKMAFFAIVIATVVYFIQLVIVPSQ
jgi:predicted membrane protein (TIGR00267 family)